MWLVALGLDTPGPSSGAFIRLTRGAASVGRDRDHDGSLPGIDVVVCSAHVLSGVGHGHLVQPQVGAVGLGAGMGKEGERESRGQGVTGLVRPLPKPLS